MTAALRTAKLLLLIEDNPGDALLVEEMLAEASPEDYEFIHVPLLADAVKKLQSVKVDIVLLDLRLPDCNGVEAVRAVRETAGQVPIVVLTGTDDEQIALECIEAGAQDYLEKNETRALSLRRSIWYAITRVREAQMRELSEERMRFALQNAKAGLWDLDCTTGTVQLSELCEHQLGLQPGAFDGKMATFFDIVHPEDRQLVSNSLQHSMLTGGDVSVEYRIVWPDGTIRWAHGIGRFQLDDQKKPLRGVGIVRDITERRLLEQQYQQSQKMEAIGNLTGGLAHDFNNLLGVIIGNLDLLRLSLTDSDSQELVDRSIDAAVRGAELTRRLLAFARRQPLVPKDIVINEHVANIVKLLNRVLGEQITITLKLGQETWPATVDPIQLEAALTNLATNARDAMPTGGRLTFATGNSMLDEEYAANHSEVEPGEYVMVSVSDTGTGMTPDVVAKIFDPFFTTKELGKGTGLGLSMVFGFMKQSRGHINIYSEPGIGTTFRLYFKRASHGERPEKPKGALSVARARGEHVLVVEDNSSLREVVMRQLADIGYRVFPAENAAVAMEVLKREAIDLLFTDIVMPGETDGFALAARAREQRPELKVVFTSGFPGTEVDTAFHEDMHGSSLLSKPYRKDELASALSAALNGTADNPPTASSQVD